MGKSLEVKDGQKKIIAIERNYFTLIRRIKNNLKNQNINILTNSYQRPLFNYISFCKHLNLDEIQNIIINTFHENGNQLVIIKNEIFNLFINVNIKYIHL